MVQNEPVYDITVVPKQVKPFDTVEFCKLLGIDKEGLINVWPKPGFIRLTVLLFLKNKYRHNNMLLSRNALSEFPGFDTQQRIAAYLS
jgi:penicillin-binding protein 2